MTISNSYGGLGLHRERDTYAQTFWQDMGWNWSPIWRTPKFVLKPVLWWRERDGFLDFYVGVPLWIPALASGVVLYFCHPLYHFRRRKRKKLGLCVKCGYDLRASKERCSECGTGFSS